MVSQENIEKVCQKDMFCEHCKNLQVCDDISVKIRGLTEKKEEILKKIRNGERVLNEFQDFIGSLAADEEDEVVVFEFRTTISKQMVLYQEFLTIQGAIDKLVEKSNKCQSSQ